MKRFRLSLPERGQRKTQPAKGKRYTRARRKEILEYAGEHSVKAAAEKFGATETTIYEWRRAIKRRREPAGEGENGDKTSERVIEDPKEEGDRKILAMWRQHPGYGPSQVRNMLKRDGFKVSVGTVRDVMERGGYLAPSLRRKAQLRRSWPRGSQVRICARETPLLGVQVRKQSLVEACATAGSRPQADITGLPPACYCKTLGLATIKNVD